jgi:PPK2 family polyphosphate:nucleotide phosphotransferase
MKLKNQNPRGPKDWDKQETKAKNLELAIELGQLVKKFHACKKQALLVVLQGSDASGKDGTIREVFKFVNAIAVDVHSFKKPTEEEMGHDYLWRVHKNLPAKGMIQVFNRSHYEDILVPGVEGFIPKKIVDKRFKHINDFESMLEDNGTKVLKFFLHVSKDKQEERLLERMSIPHKYYKHNDGDWKTREKYDLYMKKYEEIFEKCNDIPWTYVPCDRNWTKIHVVLTEVVNALKQMDLQWPDLETEMHIPSID